MLKWKSYNQGSMGKQLIDRIKSVTSVTSFWESFPMVLIVLLHRLAIELPNSKWIHSFNKWCVSWRTHLMEFIYVIAEVALLSMNMLVITLECSWISKWSRSQNVQTNRRISSTLKLQVWDRISLVFYRLYHISPSAYSS